MDSIDVAGDSAPVRVQSYSFRYTPNIATSHLHCLYHNSLVDPYFPISWISGNNSNSNTYFSSSLLKYSFVANASSSGSVCT